MVLKARPPNGGSLMHRWTVTHLRLRACAKNDRTPPQSDLSVNSSRNGRLSPVSFYTRSSFTLFSTGSSSSSPAPSSSPSFPSCEDLCFRLAFLLLLAFFFLLMSAFNAVLLSGPFSAVSIFSASRRLAIFLFCDRDLVACDLIVVPVGTCFNWTADEVLF